jgi:hypothetical protein
MMDFRISDTFTASLAKLDRRGAESCEDHGF